MSGRLEGKVAIVTGAGTGIGEAVAHKFAREGARVVVNGFPEDPISAVAQAIAAAGGEALACAADVADEAGAAACIKSALDAHGRLDILVNNAGVHFGFAEVADFPVEKFDVLLRNNCRSAFLMTKLAMPHLRRTRGNIVFAGSEAGFKGAPENTPYGGTKGFVHAFMHGVAVEAAKYGVRANCYCPGSTDTAWSQTETGALTPGMREELLGGTPMGRFGTTEEIANVVAFLASDEASFVTAAKYLVDGGTTYSHGVPGRQVPDDLRQPPRGELALAHARSSTKA